MANDQTFDVLLKEFRRVGVDPDTFSALLAVRPEEALRALQALADNAGPAAFEAQLRKNAAPGSTDSTAPRRRRDKSA